MGSTYSAECRKCGNRFEVSEGGGFSFHLLRCDLCSNVKHLSFEQIGEPHLAYLKGLDVPYSMATEERDREIQRSYRGKPLSQADYDRAVEKIAGHCQCGGSFKFDARPRCPNCRSADIIKGDITVMYD